MFDDGCVTADICGCASPPARAKVIQSGSLAKKRRKSTLSTAVSPLAPPDVPDMPEIAGVKLATAAAGIRYKGRDDLMVAILDPGTTIAGVLTRSLTASAPCDTFSRAVPYTSETLSRPAS